VANASNRRSANAIPVSKHPADRAVDAAACIGCGACEAACPKGISIDFIAQLNRDWVSAALSYAPREAAEGAI
jgi:ferredoxin